MREEGTEGGKVGHLQQETCAARVSNLMKGGVVTELSALKGRAWGGAGLGEGGLTDAVVDKLGRLRQKGLMRRGDLVNQSSGGTGS